MPRGFHVHSHVFITDFRRELSVVHLGILAPVAPLLEMFQPLSHPFFILEVTVVLLALIFGSLLPPIHVEAVSEHQNMLHHLGIVLLIDLLGAFPKINCEQLIAVEHILLWLVHVVDRMTHVSEVGHILLIRFDVLIFFRSWRLWCVIIRELMQILPQRMVITFILILVAEEKSDIIFKS